MALDFLEEFCSTTKSRVLESVWQYKEDRERLGQVPEQINFVVRSIHDTDPVSLQVMRDWLVLAGSLVVDSEVPPPRSLMEGLEWLDMACRDHSREISWEALHYLSLCRWYTRCRVVQEVAISPHLVLTCGSRAIGWEDFLLFQLCLLITVFQLHDANPRLLHVVHKFLNFPGTQRLDTIRDRTFRGQNSLYASLYDTTAFSASDRRDTVYALLGLSSNLDAGYDIAVGYGSSTTVKDVFIAAVKAIILVDGKWPFGLLSTDERYTDLPSWVPNFDVRRDTIYHYPERLIDGKAGGNVPPQPVFLDNDAIMRSPGVRLRILNGGLSLRHVWDLVDVRRQVRRAWIDMMLGHFLARSRLTFQVIQGFLEVLLVPDYLMGKVMEKLNGELDLANAMMDN